MSNSSSSSSSGISFFGLLTIVFITLKLLGLTVVATWSWWWVLSPIWIPIAIVIIVLGIMALIAFWPKQKVKIIKHDQPIIEPRKSKFMEKLEESMKESERIKELKKIK